MSMTGQGVGSDGHSRATYPDQPDHEADLSQPQDTNRNAEGLHEP